MVEQLMLILPQDHRIIKAVAVAELARLVKLVQLKPVVAVEAMVLHHQSLDRPLLMLVVVPVDRSTVHHLELVELVAVAMEAIPLRHLTEQTA